MEVPGIAAGRRFGARDSIRAAFGSPTLRHLAFAQLVFGAGLVATPALIAMVYVDRLGLDVGAIALAGLAGTAATALAFTLWGRFATTGGSLATIALGAITGVLAILLFAIAPSFIVVLAASILLGGSGAAVAVAWPLLIAEHAPDDDQSVVAAGLDSVMSLRGLLIPFVIMAPVSAGLIGPTGGLMLCALAMTVGTFVFVRMSGIEIAAHRHTIASLRGIMLGAAKDVRVYPADSPAARSMAYTGNDGVGAARMR
jgi:MFS family permease